MIRAKGNLNFAGQKQENLRAVGVAYPLRTGVVVVADAPIQKLSELKNYKGKRVPSLSSVNARSMNYASLDY